AGNFLLNNYKQALAILLDYNRDVEALKQTMPNLVDEDFVQWREEELEYLTKMQEQPEYDIQIIAYVEALQATCILYVQRALLVSLSDASFVNYTSQDFTAAGNLSQATRADVKTLEAERARIHRRLLAHMNHADETERQLKVETRWSPDDPRYVDALAYVNNRTFIRAVEHLEGLVVQRLFELSKANLASTGYKLRKHISKGIAKRSSAIRTALDKYNKLAPLQNPPRPTLEYTDVASYSWLGDFELLKYSRNDIMRKPWTVPANREVANKYFKILRAQEEINRLNVEVRRLNAWVQHEDATLLAAVNMATGSNLTAELRHRYEGRRRINNIHRVRILAIYHLEGYSGPGPFVTPLSEAPDGLGEELQDEEGQVDEDDTVQDEVLRLGDFLDALTIF
ncbi:hypothetical protein BJV78DRAFT_1129325, partial [Lactifluus subvellereus]